VLAEQGLAAVLPGKTNRRQEIEYDKEQDKLRQQVERFCHQLKQFRRIATRYDKRSRPFLAFIHLVAPWIMIR
jgi:transposase